MYGIQIIYNSDMPVFFKILLPFKVGRGFAFVIKFCTQFRQLVWPFCAHSFMTS